MPLNKETNQTNQQAKDWLQTTNVLVYYDPEMELILTNHWSS